MIPETRVTIEASRKGHSTEHKSFQFLGIGESSDVRCLCNRYYSALPPAEVSVPANARTFKP